MKRKKLKMILKNRTKCEIQANGWCCGTCFFSISKELTNQDWQSLLYFRGDTKKEYLNNLPRNIEESLDKIYQLAVSY